MSDDIVMKVAQRNVFSAGVMKGRRAAESAARRDPVVRAGLNYIGGPSRIRNVGESEDFSPPDENEHLRGVYAEGESKVYVNPKFSADFERVVPHELSHAASRRFWEELEHGAPDLAEGTNKHLDKIDLDSEPWDSGAAEEARNRLMDQKRGIKPGHDELDQTIEDYKFVRDFTHKGFNEGDTGEKFRAARKREEELMNINAAMEEHFAKYGGGK